MGAVPPLKPDQASDIAGEVGDANLHRRATKADGADDQPHARLLVREHMLDGRARRRAGMVGTLVGLAVPSAPVRRYGKWETAEGRASTPCCIRWFFEMPYTCAISLMVGVPSCRTARYMSMRSA
ncbi:hypothetical protein GCM10022293_52380 [Azospirillum formosense]